VLSNLVGNAIKFTANGGVSVKALVDGVDEGGTHLRFEVADSGIGIDDAGRKRLFAPFVQVDAATTRQFGGTGLGLAISKRLVGLMGGQIGVDSIIGQGSTFWFTAVLAKATPAEIAAVQTADQPVARNADIVGAHVLVAEDNPPNKRLIERLLARLGVDAEIVGNGVDAVSAAGSRAFDLILMDCHMPELDGFDATRAIRAGGSAIPIIALTADAMSGDREACVAAGMDDYLAKPIATGDLVRMLRRWLPDRQSETAAEPEPRAIRVTRSGRELDGARIAELCALDPDSSAGFLAHMVADYEATLKDTIPAIRAAVESGDVHALEEAAHKLKGTAAQLGAVRVNDGAVRLLALCRSGSLLGAELILADLEGTLAPTVSALRELLTGTAGQGHKAA
jgi:CheY-like chemotaxis protein/HPt (histidine-containing phosphotransfer) domain-containing protein